MSGNLQLWGSSFKCVWNSLKTKMSIMIKNVCAHTNYRQFLFRFLQFTLRLGSKSVLSTCKAPDQPGEGVLLHYSYDNGITWKLLEHYSYLNYHEPRYVANHLGKIVREIALSWGSLHSNGVRFQIFFHCKMVRTKVDESCNEKLASYILLTQ